MRFRDAIILLSLLLPVVLCADTVVDWQLSPSDTSYQFLAFLFGHVSDDLICYFSGCSQVVPLIFQSFNQSVLILASMVLAYVSVISTGASAHQGEFLGRRYSSLWTPIKTVTGLSFINPTSTGYNLLQIIIIKTTLLGVALANNLYGVVANYVTQNNSSFGIESQNTTASAQYEALLEFSSKVYPHELCYAYYQQASALYRVNPTEAENLGFTGTNETFYKGPTEYSCADKLFGYDYNNDSASMSVECSAQSPLRPPSPDTCGYWTYFFSDSDPDKDMTQQTLNILVNQLRVIAQNDVSFYLESGIMDTYVNHGTFTAAQQQAAQDQAQISIIQIAYSIPLVSTQLIAQSLGTVSSNSVSYGAGSDWLDFLKNFYDFLNRSGSGGSVNFLNINEMKTQPGSAMTNSGAVYNAMVSSINNQNYFEEGNLPDGSASSYNGLQKPSGGSTSAAVKVYNTFNTMLSQGKDPLISLAVFGQQLLQFSFDMLFSSIIVSAALVVVTAICASKQNLFASGITTALGMFIVNIMLICGFLIPIGVVLGIFLPTMPLMIYAFGALHWFIAVIEAVVAGPVIALAFMVPTQQQDLLGKAQPAVMMMLQVFIRPSGMVLGMVFGAKLFDVIAVYFTESFIIGLTFIQDQLSGMGAFRDFLFVIYFFFYSFVIVGIATRCYSLINALPDRIISWVSGPMGQVSQEVEEDLGVYRQAVDKAGQDMKENYSSLAQGLGGSMKEMNKAISQNNKDTNEQVPGP